MSDMDIMLCIIGMCIVSYIPRAFPALLLSGRQMPELVERWLNYVPTAVFGALIFSEVFIEGDHVNMSFTSVNFQASIIVLIVAAKTKSLGKSIIVGLTVFYVLKNYF